MILVLIHYTKSPDEIDRLRPVHREYLRTWYEKGKLVFSGPRHSRTGGVVLTTFQNAVEAQAFADGDPYHLEGAATHELIPFEPISHDPLFAPFIVRSRPGLE